MSQLRSPSILNHTFFSFQHQVLDNLPLSFCPCYVCRIPFRMLRASHPAPYSHSSSGPSLPLHVYLPQTMLTPLLRDVSLVVSPHASSDAARLPSCHVFSLIVGPFSPPSCLPSAAFRSPAATPSTVLFPTSADSPFTSVTSAFHPVRPRVREMVTCLHATPSSLEADFAHLSSLSLQLSP